MTSMAKPKVVHLPIPMGAPGASESLFADPKLWCGKTGDYKTSYVRDRNKATCKRCIEKDLQHEEDVAYQQAMQKRKASE